MTARYTATQVGRMAALLETEVHDAAAVLALAEELWRERSLFTVVGQLSRNEAGPVDPSDDAAIKVALGWYSTIGDATKAAASLVIGRGDDEYRAWVLPVVHCSPSEIRKDAIEAFQAKAEASRRAKFRTDAEKYAELRAASIQAALA